METPKPRRSSAALRLLATALLSGTVCYRLGRFAGCATPWLADVRSGYYDYGWDGDRDDDASHYLNERQTRLRSRPEDSDVDRRFVPRPSQPYDCGVVFFYHIPCTGGASINQWFRKYQLPEFGNISYYQWWALETRKDGSFHPYPELGEAKFARGMTEHIQDLGPNEWRIAHSHLVSTYLNESEDLLYQWRSDVEAQGCELINAVMLRDPLNHAMSLHKIIKSKNSTQDVWTRHLASPTEPGLWATVLDFFLYNNHGLRHRDDYPNGPGGRNPYNVTKEEKVARAMELLHRHFDVVTVSDHAAFRETILNWTGWYPLPIKKSNVGRRALHFTKKEVEWLQKGLQRNGDFDFVDRVKYEYHDHLAYLDG